MSSRQKKGLMMGAFQERKMKIAGRKPLRRTKGVGMPEFSPEYLNSSPNFHPG
jgi:hypothetical protein